MTDQKTEDHSREIKQMFCKAADNGCAIVGMVKDESGIQLLISKATSRDVLQAAVQLLAAIEPAINLESLAHDLPQMILMEKRLSNISSPFAGKKNIQ
ncbi:hypothetical protein [Megasphaera sueciensis]|uniref:hypothetical protein n=1 Tax=Megasphaera sueciensis TaxID=349094 RepID=UPI003D01C05F